MPTLSKGSVLRPGDPEATSASPGARAAHHWSALLAWLSGLIRRNRLCTAALALAVVPRLTAMLAYRPAILFRLDTYDYLWDAVHLRPNPANPSGYSLFLALLRPFRSLTLVVTLQHLMGLAVAIMIYAVLRNRGVRTWIATLAALPVLFDPAQILLEHLVMADIVGLFLMMAAFVVLLVRSIPSLWRSVTAGLLMGVSVLARPTALPLIVLLAVYLIVVRAGWRRAVAALAAGLVPVAGYMMWFATVYGSFNMTNSNGLFLWSRTMSFANCAVIKPPADLRALCPAAQPGPLAQPVAAKREAPKRYLWAHAAWQWQPASADFVPDVAAFTKANNSRALHFAIKAILAQPFSYAHVVASESLQPFGDSNAVTLRFPVLPITAGLSSANQTYAAAAVRAYTGSPSLSPYLGYHFGTKVTSPWARLIGKYQKIIFLPGPVFALIFLVALAGLIIPRRRSWAAALLWVSAVIVLVLPIAEHEYTYRYAIPAVPLVCMAAALAFRDRDKVPVPAGSLGAEAAAETTTDHPADPGPLTA